MERSLFISKDSKTSSQFSIKTLDMVLLFAFFFFFPPDWPRNHDEHTATAQPACARPHRHHRVRRGSSAGPEGKASAWGGRTAWRKPGLKLSG